MSGIGLLQPDVCEVQLAHDHVQPHQHVQLHHLEVLGHPEAQIRPNFLLFIIVLFLARMYLARFCLDLELIFD